jgi:phosphonate transport system ATP-binding protein
MVAPSKQGGAPPPAPPGGQPLLEGRDLWFSYDRRSHVLRGVSMTARAGRVLMLLGRSGSGKTTLLKVLKGLVRPEQGVVVSRSPDGGPLEPSAIAYIPQTLGLVRSLTALENALCGALARTGVLRSSLHSFPASTRREAYDVLARLGVAHKADAPVYYLSGGERQRVAIARALMQRPAVILADEFVSQLDYHTAEDILALMRGVAEGGVALVVTTHEVDVATEHGDEVAIMHEGRITHRARSGDFTMGELLDLLK